jgi:hypothetical protein
MAADIPDLGTNRSVGGRPLHSDINRVENPSLTRIRHAFIWLRGDALIPHSKLGMIAFVLALLISTAVMYETGYSIYLARSLPEQIWHLSAVGAGDVQITHIQEKPLNEFMHIWQKTLCCQLLPTEGLAFVLGAVSLGITHRRKLLGVLAMLISAITVIIALLVLGVFFSFAPFNPFFALI